MRVTHLELADYRNYSAASLEFVEGQNLLLGRNGQGKTNLVEAIGLFSRLGSHRVSNDKALIRASAVSGSARIRVEALGRSVLLELTLSRDKGRKARINSNPAQIRELPRWFSSVLFAPEDLDIVRGGPGARRAFLDESVVGRRPAMAGVVSDYERVLRQRNSLLKSAMGNAQAVESTLPFWDEQLIEYGTQIVLARRNLVELLLPHVRTTYSSLVEGDHSPNLYLSESVFDDTQGSDSEEGRDVSRETRGENPDSDFGHRSNVSRETVATAFANRLSEHRTEELRRGVTLIGPHRDDLVATLNRLPVKGYASHGETWSFVLSLKLALANLIRDESPTGDPVIILDDVFAELDSIRRERLKSQIADYEQVIVTAAHSEEMADLEFARKFIVEAGSAKLVGPGGDGETRD